MTMSNEEGPKLNVRSYGIGFSVPKEMAEELQRAAADHMALFERQIWNDAFMEPRPFVPPTRRQRLRTWLATKLLKVVEWLDYEVIPW
jgi:hypothetical protein